MRKEELALEIQGRIEGYFGSYTEPSKKKENGFIVFNRHSVEIGEVDVTKSKLYIKLYVNNNLYQMEELMYRLHLPERKNGSRYSGLYIKSLEKHDKIQVFLYADYFSPVNSVNLRELYKFIEEAARIST
ncbi:hypothetical protein LGQ02_18380 [Bacillus shivajii]|uniref:hypothetical protein n=1 Tax=Bacillus shivajii TaxID=1983719 RepID=UPI001CF9945E|nr:hypothetical protein [Bacillus shivajii]UCZ52728.1 hypothetical protein LGQ02_18380 [Bacillus shivajii]